MTLAVYPPVLGDHESREIRRRRGALPDRASSPDRNPRDGENFLPDDCVGLALSGGGIRSATVCLGVLRALARAGKLGHVDFLSTVSGGGYAGSFLGGLFVWRRGEPGPPTLDEIERDLLDLGSKPVDWLRENGRYMSPNGAGDTLLAGAIVLRNWLAVMFVVSSFVFTLFAAAAGIGRLLERWWEWASRLAWVATVNADVPWALLSPARLSLAPSPYLGASLLLALLAVLPLGWAYWFTQRRRSRVWSTRMLIAPALFPLILLASGVTLAWARPTAGAALLAFESAAALAWWRIAVVSGGRGERFERNRLSRWLSNALWSTSALAVFGLVDSLGRTLASASQRELLWKTFAGAAAALAAGFGVVQKLLPLVGSERTRRLSPTPQLLAGIAAALVSAFLLAGSATLAHVAVSAAPLWLAVGCGLVVTLFTGWTMPFLNLSSHSSLYGARLTRAYLGASNPRRQRARSTITELLEGDQVALSNYDPPAAGGPLHLVNVTLNETVSAASQLEQRDRKGLAMAVGPCGISVGRTDHALWNVRGRSFAGIPHAAEARGRVIFPRAAGHEVECEELDLGAWAGISGAAFTTGLGARTSLSLSLLLGLANVRLGYWWDSGLDAPARAESGGAREALSARLERWAAAALPVHAYLFQELLARFHGPALRCWYLSDGGHFENTGAYELIRRRLPFVVLCDNGCDPGSRFDDLANLARRVRTDFHAELAVFTAQQLDAVLAAGLRDYFGTMEDFRTPPAAGRPHALMAGVFYEDPLRERPPGTVLVILKPGVSGDEPPDVVQYQREHEAFPNEPTIDQYFDEAQWESYRRLGEHIASRVFEDVREPGAWRPLDFRKPPMEHVRWRGASSRLGAAAGVS